MPLLVGAGGGFMVGGPAGAAVGAAAGYFLGKPKGTTAAGTAAAPTTPQPMPGSVPLSLKDQWALLPVNGGFVSPFSQPGPGGSVNIPGAPILIQDRGFSGLGFGELTLPSLPGGVPAPMLIGAVAGFLFGGRTIGSALMGGALGYLIAGKGAPALPGQGLTTIAAPGGSLPAPGGTSPSGAADSTIADILKRAQSLGIKPPFQAYGDDVDQTQPDETGGQWWTQHDDGGQPETDAQWCAVEDEESMIEATMSAEEDAAATDALVHAREAPPTGGGVVPHLIGAGAGFLLAGPLGAAAGALLPFLGKKS